VQHAQLVTTVLLAQLLHLLAQMAPDLPPPVKAHALLVQLVNPAAPVWRSPVITTGTVLHQLAQLSLMAASVLLEPTFRQTREGRRLLLTAAPAQLESTALLVEWLEPALLAISASVELHHRHLRELH
jgi:hypothetical protein